MDNKFTQELTDWLNTPRDQRDILAGAMMLLRLNKNRFFYANVCRRPDKFHDKLEYELRKHLAIRLDNMTIADVVRLEAQVIPQAKKTLATPPAVVSTDDELPKAKTARGRRDDHDRLPAQVQELWDKNLQLYKTIKQVFEQLKGMEKAQPCDRYEYLKILDETDKKYRRNLELYDNYVLGSGPNTTAIPEALEKTKSPSFRLVLSARKTLSKYKKILAKALDDNDKDKAETARIKILKSITTIRENGAIVGEAVLTELKGMGIFVE